LNLTKRSKTVDNSEILGLDLYLALSNGKIKTINLNDFSPLDIKFLAHKIHSYSKEYYNIPAILENEDAFNYTRGVDEF
jgi:hypothetical protein